MKKMVEKKSVKGKKRKISKYTAKGLQEVSLSMIKDFSIYKAKEAGKEVIFVDPKNTTQRCSQCGKLANPKIERDVEILHC